MQTWVSFATLYEIAAAVAVLAAISLLRAWIAWRRQLGQFPGGIKRLCGRFILGHPKSAGMFMATTLLMPLPIAPVTVAAFVLSPYPSGIYLILPLALLGIGAALFLGVLAAVGSTLFAIQRLRGEASSFGLLYDTLRARLEDLWSWLKELVMRREGAFFNPFVLPALLADACDMPTAGRRAAAFAQQAPEAVQAVLPLHRRALGAAFATLVLLFPAAIGFFCLPALSFIGFAIFPLPWGIELYGLACALLGLALCGAVALLSFRFACAFVHAAAVYVYATGSAQTRERVLAHLPSEAISSPTPEGPAPVAPAPTPEPPALGPAIVPAPSEYAKETMLPQAGRLERFQEQEEPPPQVARTEEAALVRSAAPRSSFFASPLIILSMATALVVLIFLVFDGVPLLQRQYAMACGQPAVGALESMQAAPKGGILLYRATFSYAWLSGAQQGQALVAEGAFGRLPRGAKVALHILPGPPPRAFLDEDFGFGRQRAALLLALTLLIAAGGWSLAFRTGS